MWLNDNGDEFIDSSKKLSPQGGHDGEPMLLMAELGELLFSLRADVLKAVSSCIFGVVIEDIALTDEVLANKQLVVDVLVNELSPVDVLANELLAIDVLANELLADVLTIELLANDVLVNELLTVDNCTVCERSGKEKFLFCCFIKTSDVPAATRFSSR